MRAKWTGVVGGSGPRSDNGIGSISFGAVVCGGRRADMGSANDDGIEWTIVDEGKEEKDRKRHIDWTTSTFHQHLLENV